MHHILPFTPSPPSALSQWQEQGWSSGCQLKKACNQGGEILLLPSLGKLQSLSDSLEFPFFCVHGLYTAVLPLSGARPNISRSGSQKGKMDVKWKRARISCNPQGWTGPVSISHCPQVSNLKHGNPVEAGTLFTGLNTHLI